MIENFPLFYISFKKNIVVERHYKQHGFKNIFHFKAIDGRKLDPKKLLEDNLITIRSYDDLLSIRNEHSGMPSLGAIGCSLSHYELWNICVKNNFPYIIITEEDNRINRKITNYQKMRIYDIIKRPNGIFLSVHISKQGHRKQFFGTHFCILSRNACMQLIKNFFPIDVQVDWYIGNQSDIGNVNLNGFVIGSQKIHTSGIQDVCVKCFLPNNFFYYILFFVLVLLIIIYYRRLYIFYEKSYSRSISQ
jgi:hypothetical protein